MGVCPSVAERASREVNAARADGWLPAVARVRAVEASVRARQATRAAGSWAESGSGLLRPCMPQSYSTMVIVS